MKFRFRRGASRKEGTVPWPYPRSMMKIRKEEYPLLEGAKEFVHSLEYVNAHDE